MLAAANQNLAHHSPSGKFLMLGGVWTLLVSGVAGLVMIKKSKRKIFACPKQALVSSVLYGVISSLSSLFIVISLETLNASVQYPLITSGTMVFSALICLLRREKLTARDLIAVIVATVSSVVVIL